MNQTSSAQSDSTAVATPTFAVLQLSGCSGCEVSLLNADVWASQHELVYMPLVLSAEDLPPVDTLLVSGAVYSDDDLHRLQQTAHRARRVVAVGTCALSGGVANLGNRESARRVFLDDTSRRHLPRLLPQLRPVDAVVSVDLYLPGCPPTPRLFEAALKLGEPFEPAKTVCQDCGRIKTRDRPDRLARHSGVAIDPEVCLINQGYLCIGSSTRGGCGAPCTRAGHPCVGCRGPSNGFISRSADEWFAAIKRVFERMTAISREQIDAELRSPGLSLFVFQFADYAGAPRDIEKVL
jgi:F420-non-reducing hydrogenase small subunit